MASGPLRAHAAGRIVRGVTDPAAPRPLRVLVVDPDDRTRESLCGILAIGQRCVVVGSAGDAEEALGLVRRLTPDIVVVDANIDEASMPAGFVGRIRALSPATRIVAMSRNGPEDAEGHRMVGGADAVIRKTFRPRELIGALLDARIVTG